MWWLFLLALADDVPTTAPWFVPRVPAVEAPDDFFHTPGTLYLNFEGAQMQSCNGSDWPVNNCSTIMNDVVLPYSGDASAREAVVQIMAADVEPFAVTIVGERPVDDDEYDMVMVGNWEPPPEEGGFAGVAPTIDCYNMTRGETSFSLDLGSASTVAKVVGQEAAHVWGLEHVDSPNDLLFPTTGGAGDPSFEDACHQIVVLDGGIQPTEANCAEMHELNCPDAPDHQNSYQDMMMVFGPRTPDMSAPTLEIVAPVEGETFASGSTVEVRIMMIDEVAPPLFEVYASIDADEMGALLDDYRGPELVLPITALPDGEHLVRIDIQDQSGNPATDLVHFVIGGDAVDESSGGSDESSGGGEGTTSADSAESGMQLSSDGSTDASDTEAPANGSAAQGCSCRTTPRHTIATLGLLVLVLSRRRR
jgi:MYXO-CTERM domain-containing protein